MLDLDAFSSCKHRKRNNDGYYFNVWILILNLKKTYKLVVYKCYFGCYRATLEENQTCNLPSHLQQVWCSLAGAYRCKNLGPFQVCSFCINVALFNIKDLCQKRKIQMTII